MFTCEHAPSVGDLTEEEYWLLQQVEELVGTDLRFRKAWILRIRENPMKVKRALAETRMLKTEQKIKRSPGGTLNWHFRNFCKGGKKHWIPL